MKYATVSLPDGNYTETAETWLLVNSMEVRLLHAAVESYAREHKRSKLAQRLLKELDNTPFL